MTVDFESILFYIESTVNRAKFNSEVKFNCENSDDFSLTEKALKNEIIAFAIKCKRLKVEVVLLDYYQQAQTPFCLDCGEPLTAINHDITEGEPTAEEKTIIVFSANEATIIALMGALLAVSKANGSFDDYNDFSEFLYNIVDCGISDVERIPDINKHQLLLLAKDVVSYHVKKGKYSTKDESTEKAGHKG